MRIRVTGAFVTKWYEEWKFSGDNMLRNYFSRPTGGEHHARVERFLEAMAPDITRALKDNLLHQLLMDAAAIEASAQNKNSPGTDFPVDTVPPAA